jgi:hypothetical protein
VIWLSPAPAIYYADPFRWADVPPVIMDWRIHRIELQEGPLITRGDFTDYDPSHLKTTDVQDTREGEDFLLHCELVSGWPVSILSRELPLSAMADIYPRSA